MRDTGARSGLRRTHTEPGRRTRATRTSRRRRWVEELIKAGELSRAAAAVWGRPRRARRTSW
eukprot:228427-Lingulodinium_polyedra.AAC.1